jgi:S-adenosylmethionine:tRNA ribosyltransferase-isomerase
MKHHFDPKTVNYDLPEDRIAVHPLPERDQSKLLIMPKGENIPEHSQFHTISQWIPTDSLMFVNVSKVIHARIHCIKESGGMAEVLLNEPALGAPADAMMHIGQSDWKCIIGGKKILSGMILQTLDEQFGFRIEVLEKNGMDAIVRLQWKGEQTLSEILEEIGKIPLPPYLHREAEEEDEERYQTVYAKDKGSVAAPTAGLHFTDRVFEDLKQKSILIEELTLHVGLGTFKPFDAEEVDEFSMHAEKIIVRKEVIESCIAFFSNEQRGACIAVGTTSCRTMESLYWFGVSLCNQEFSAWKSGQFSFGQWDAYALFDHAVSVKKSFETILHWMNEFSVNVIEGQTQLMIVPGYQWGMIEGLITNFHQPESTLLFLVSSFLGIERWKKAYQSALENDYRFLSYGDSSLLWR